MAGVLPQKRTALAETTNDEPELDGNDKRRRASIEGQLAEPPAEKAPPPTVASESEEEEEEEESLNADLKRRCAAALCWNGGWVQPDDVAVVCEACCAPDDTFHATCASVDPAKLPAFWLCPECEDKQKAKAVAAEKAALKKDDDCDYEEEEAKPKKKREPRKCKGPILDDEGFPLHSGGVRKVPSKCNPEELKEYHKAKAKKEAEGAAELKAAAAALKAHDLYDKARYQVILGEVEAYVADDGTKAIAASWIWRLMSEGKDRMTPSVVRTIINTFKQRRGAKVESEEDDEEDNDDADEVMPQPKKRGAPRTRGA